MTAYRYIDTPDALGAAIDRLAHEPLLGVDTEAAGYHRYLDRISLIQISSRTETVLVDPLALDDLSGLSRLLGRDAIETVFHDADFDLRILDRDLGLHVVRLFDTQIAAAFLGAASLGLGAVLEAYLGVSLPKAFQRADWAARPLTDGMKDYAATDTAYLPALRDVLRTRLEDAGRLAWAEEEFVRRTQTRHVPNTDGEAYLKIKGARDLSRRALAILRELHAWREDVARTRDQAPFRIVQNEVLLHMSREGPASSAALRKVPGLFGGLVERRGAEMLAAIERGRAVADADLPRWPEAKPWERDPQVEARIDRLRAARSTVSAALGLDGGFLVSRAQLEEVARQNPTTLEALEAGGILRRWQREVLGPSLLEALHARG